MDVMLLDFVDYWLDFDKDEGLVSIFEGVEVFRCEGELRLFVKWR